MDAHHEISSIQNPPTGFLSSLRFLGPGFILSAAIVGSGELIATTVLGGKTGFLLLWVILFGCLIKVAIQLEYGRYCIIHGIPSFQAWHRESGRNWYSLHWTLYIGFLFMVTILIGQAGVLGGAAQVMAYVIPSIHIEFWVVILAFSLALLVFRGKYGLVEFIAAGFNFVFVFSVVYCVFSVQKTQYAFGLHDMVQGFSFRLPTGAVAFALGAFGITGVGSGEIVIYPYWCLEKGYAAWTGPNDGSDAWAKRARGWIRVMMLDALAAMVVYTLVTCAFYILGATVLRAQEKIVEGNGLILQLSTIFTQVLGEKTRLIYMAGAFVVLFSTVFANTAGFARLWADFFGVCRWIDIRNPRHKFLAVAVMSWILPGTWALVYLAFQQPLYLVIFMGICNSLFLLVVAYQAIVFRYRYSDPNVLPSRIYDFALWLSIFSIGFVAWRSFWTLKEEILKYLEVFGK